MECSTFPLLALPAELLLQILDALDHFGLFAVLLVSKALAAKALPILWSTIDLPALVKNVHYPCSSGRCCSNPHRESATFFSICHRLQRFDPLRWQYLASLVRSFTLSRYPGLPEGYRIPNSQELNHTESHRSIFSIVKDFINIEELRIYLCSKSWRYEELDISFRRLRKLEIGGTFREETLRALLSKPEEIEELVCVGLYDDNHGWCPCKPPEFLQSIAHRFTKLKVLRLAKLCGVFSDGDNQQILEDWAALLRHVSRNLVELTLEDLYFCRYTYDPADSENDSWYSDESDAFISETPTRSTERFRKLIRPILLSQQPPWSRLKKMVLTGINYDHAGSPPSGDDELRCSLPQDVVLQQQPGEFISHDPEGNLELCGGLLVYGDD